MAFTAMTAKNDKSILWSKSPTSTKPHCLTVTNIWSWAQNGAWHKDCLADWPSVVMWLRLSLRLVGWLMSNWREKVSEWIERGRDPAESLPIRREWPVLSDPLLWSQRRPISKLEKVWNEENIVVDPDGVRYQEGLHWEGPVAIYWTGKIALERARCNLLDWKVVSFGHEASRDSRQQ
jgi:hypothetical protein